MTTSKQQQPADPINIAFYLLAFGALSIALLLNWQPWWVLGKHVVNQIDILPLIGWMDRTIFQSWGARAAGAIIALIGWAKMSNNEPVKGTLVFVAGLICLVSPSVFFENLSIVVGTVLWGWCQWVQLMPLFVEMAGIRKPEWVRQLRHYRVVAYLLEIIACLMLYPPYAGGVTEFIRDWQRFGMPLGSKWSWVNFAWTAGTVVSVELTLVFLVIFALQAGVLNPSTNTQQRPSGEEGRGPRRAPGRGPRRAPGRGPRRAPGRG